MCNLPHFNKYRLGSGLGGGAVLLIWFSVILWQGIINNLAPKMHHHMDRVSSEHSPMWRQGVPFYCLGSPSSGKMSEVQQKRQEEGWRQKKKNRRKGNSNALPGNSREPATTSPHDISERKCDTPSSNTSEQHFIQHSAISIPNRPNITANALYITPTDTIHRIFVHL